MRFEMLDRNAVSRILQDRISVEINALRGGTVALLPPGHWADTLRIGLELGADSLEMMALAGAVNEFFHLHDTGCADLLLARRQFGDWVDLAHHACGREAARITFRTSGSTGSPKRCTHSLASLATEAAEHVGRLQPGRIFAAVPTHHIYGFIFSALVPSLAGCQVVDMRAHLPEHASFGAGDLIVSYPDHWRFPASTYRHLPAVTGVTSGGPMNANLAREISEQGVRLIEIYGASETAGIGWRDHPDAPFTLLDRWQVACTPAGRGILALVDRTGHGAATQDEVDMIGSRSFWLLGRPDGAVQVGGINVYPARVAALLQSHTLISRALVQLTDHGQGGRLAAVLVPEDPAADLEALRMTIGTWIKTNLAPPEQPRSLVFESEATWKRREKLAHWSRVDG